MSPTSSHTPSSRSEISLQDLVRDKLVLVALADGKISPSDLRSKGARDVLLLEKDAPQIAEKHADHVRKHYRRIPDIRKNNCNLAILHGTASFALLEKREFGRFTHVLLPAGKGWFATRLGLFAYGKRGLLRRIGTTKIVVRGVETSYTVLSVHYQPRDQTRQYGPAGLSPREILQSLPTPIQYITLRGSEAIESGQHKGDIDLLVARESLAPMKEWLSQQIGTYSIDVYSDDGQEGHAYKSVPYVTAKLAKELLDSAYSTAAGIRIASPYWRYISYCFHLLFHDKCRAEIDAAAPLTENTFVKSHYLGELHRLARESDQTPPQSIDAIEALLRSTGTMPSLDLIGFYSNRSPFLKSRYFGKAQLQPGLATFFVRDFGAGISIVAPLRERLLQTFEILVEGPVEGEMRESIIQGVRGGNWADADAPSGRAEPVYWFVCIDPKPAPLSARSQRKHPRLDNENIRIKDDLRKEIGEGDKKGTRIIHSSDNSMEALDHLHHLGLVDHPAIAEVLQKLKIS